MTFVVGLGARAMAGGYSSSNGHRAFCVNGPLQNPRQALYYLYVHLVAGCDAIIFIVIADPGDAADLTEHTKPEWS
jgi:hypothetical protein